MLFATAGVLCEASLFSAGAAHGALQPQTGAESAQPKSTNNILARISNMRFTTVKIRSERLLAKRAES